jgi:hypothetical protein
MTEIFELHLPGIERQVVDVRDNRVRDVQRDFPQYRIWREVTGGREPRYVAKARHLGVRLHTVMTADLAELRSELAAAPTP